MARRKQKTAQQVALENEKAFLEKYIAKASARLERVTEEWERLEEARG